MPSCQPVYVLALPVSVLQYCPISSSSLVLRIIYRRHLESDAYWHLEAFERACGLLREFEHLRNDLLISQ
jgi:hypothetical protein